MSGAGDELDASHILRAAGRTAVAWRNGGGVTREVAVHPPGAGWDAFDWRVSLAEVTADGPYSPLPGVRRILTVVAGAGTELTVAGTTRLRADRYRPLAFPGGAATAGRLLDGPVVNLNVMLREGRARATVEMVRGSRRVAAGPGSGAGTGSGADGGRSAGQGVLVMALEGRTRLSAPGEPVVTLERFDAVWLAGARAAAAELGTDGVAAVVTLSA
ncbi:HutD/Ves family protein [Streptomyces celluloflavus]|uniref:HutD/Ves family protein n=1 Tax=Streptomyces celluloflavus TaxID=58344 RepID=UPI00365FDAF6